MLKKAQEAERKAREAEEKTQGHDREMEEDIDTSGSKPQAEKDVRRISINTEWSLAFSKNNNCLIKLKVKSLVTF